MSSSLSSSKGVTYRGFYRRAFFRLQRGIPGGQFIVHLGVVKGQGFRGAFLRVHIVSIVAF